MIKVSVDYGYAFDMLSILEVKKENNSNNINLENYERLYNEIKDQINTKLFYKIIQSLEYLNLKNINKKVFDLVDIVKNDNGLAKEVDKANYQRYVAKTNLQKIYFEINPTEIKIGYSK